MMIGTSCKGILVQTHKFVPWQLLVGRQKEHLARKNFCFKTNFLNPHKNHYAWYNSDVDYSVMYQLHCGVDASMLLLEMAKSK